MKFTFLILSSKSDSCFFRKCYSDFQVKVNKAKITCLFLGLLGLGFCAHAQQTQILQDSTKAEKFISIFQIVNSKIQNIWELAVTVEDW